MNAGSPPVVDIEPALRGRSPKRVRSDARRARTVNGHADIAEHTKIVWCQAIFTEH